MPNPQNFIEEAIEHMNVVKWNRKELEDFLSFQIQSFARKVVEEIKREGPSAYSDNMTDWGKGRFYEDQRIIRFISTLSNLNGEDNQQKE